MTASAFDVSMYPWRTIPPSGWRVQRLKRVVRLLSRRSGIPGLPYVGLENIESGTGRWLPAEEAVTEESLASRFEQGDVLFGKLRPYLAKVLLTEWSGCCSSELLVLRPAGVLPEFLRYVLLAEETIRLINASTFGTKMPRADWTFIGRVVIPTPDTTVQRRIVAFLDRKTAAIDALIAKKERLIELLQEKRQALITQVVTKGLDPNVPMKDSGQRWIGMVPAHWDVKKLKWETRIKRGASPRPIDDPKYFDESGESGWVRIEDVTASSMYLTSTSQRLSALGASLSVRLQPGQVMLSIAGSVGKTCIAGVPCCIHDGFVYFPDWKGDSRFLYFLMSVGEAFRGLGKLGTQLNLNTDTVGSIPVAIPPKAEQSKIAEFLRDSLRDLDTCIALAQRQIECLCELRQEVISAAVSGRTEVPTKEAA